MTSGKWVAIAIVGLTVIFGATQWYFQTRAFYTVVGLAEAQLHLTLSNGERVALAASAFDGIDADTSPLRFRGCFTLTDTEQLADAVPYPDPAPLIAPAWFDCFDATSIGEALEQGRAQAYLGAREFAVGVDRVIAVFPDGRGYAWTQLNGTLE